MPQPTSYTTLKSGTVLAKRYRIEQVIGSGGYASVYRATDLTFGFDRAIKEVVDPDPGVRNQFRLEGELLINTRHRNIPAGYHLIEEDGRLYLVMDYVLGKDLEELLNESLTRRKQPLEEQTVVEWMSEICDALEAMHTLRHPVIHRDIKPANIKITPDGVPVLIDFGLAKVQHPGPTMTAAQGVSPGFAPPEQYMARGKTDARTDIYALGATFYACLTGQDPPEAPARLLAETGAAGGGMVLVPPRRMNPRISEEANRIVLKALELSPGKRYQTAADMRRDLESLSMSLSRSGKGKLQLVGVECKRCGAQNKPGAATCVECGSPLRPNDGGAPQGERGGARSGGKLDGTGKQPVPGKVARSTRSDMPAVALGGKGGLLTAASTAKQAAVPAAVPAVPAVVAAAMSAKQKAVNRLPEAGTPPPASLTATGTMVKLPAKTADPEKLTAGRLKATPAPAAAPQAEANRAWIRLGDQQLGGFGKTMLVFSVVEVLWGAFALALAVVALATRGHNFPGIQVAAAWAVITLIVSVVGGQAIARPVYRRNRLVPVRRWLQGIGLAIYTIALHGVAIWGATIFQSSQSNPTLAPIAFVLFGVNVLLVGVLAVVNTLN